MRIETSYINSAILKNINENSSTTTIHRGQIFSGKVLSMEGRSLNIMTPDGTNIRAFLEGEAPIPLNTPLVFEIIENAKDRVVIKPLIQNAAKEATREESIIGLAGSLGIDVDGESISYLNKEGFVLGRNLQKLMTGLEGDESLLQKVKNMFVTQDKLVEYLKGFESESGAKFIKNLNELFSEVKKGTVNPKMCMEVLGDMVKGLFVQINHPYPLFYIPIPLLIDNKLYNGEIWVEKNGEKKGVDTLDDISIYVFVDTPTLGRVEANIRALGGEINLNLFCNKEVLPLLKEDLNVLKDRINFLGLSVKSINASELQKKRSFIDLVQKYVEPFKPIDVRA